jgi:hypothetical protein
LSVAQSHTAFSDGVKVFGGPVEDLTAMGQLERFNAVREFP